MSNSFCTKLLKNKQYFQIHSSILKHLIYYRKQRRRTIQHAQEVIDNPDDVQVHPTAIEPSVPLGNNF